MLTPEVITDVRGIPATTVERTLLDLCSVGRRWSVEAALDGAIRTGKTSLDAIGDRFVREARKGRRGIQLMRLMLTERGLGEAISDSGLHSEFVRFLRKHSITGFDQFYPVRDETGFYVEIDVAFPEKMLGFEVDGYSAHGGKQAFDHDRERERKLILRGWRIVRITKADLKKPHELIQDIRALLRDR
jgi:very-short-patch-repair endonuclease